ncbi:MAG: hypothetical protein NTY95_19000 [Bacteroidia bacterium]|nr:hypothetical protein [Bacteroidia bacterium]
MRINFGWQAGVAFYGAILSTILGLLKIMEYIANKPKLLIKMEVVKMTSNGHGWTKPQFAVMISNNSNKPITIYVVTIKLPKGNYFMFPSLVNFSLPYELKEGNQCVASTDLVKFRKNLIDLGYLSNKIKIFAVVKDGAERTYKSKKYLLDFEKLYKKWKINPT